MQAQIVDAAGDKWQTSVFSKVIEIKRPAVNLAYLKHDFELWGISRCTYKGSGKNSQGLPETIKAVEPRFIDMTRAWQFYWVDLFSLSRYGKLYKALNSTEKLLINNAFRGVTVGWRAFNNKHGWDDGYADYVNNVNTRSAPMGQETITTGGNVVELLSGKMRTGGVDCYKVRTLRAKDGPPDPLKVNHIDTPHLVFKATISRREGYNAITGKWAREDIVIPFPQLQDFDVPIPFVGFDTYNYIAAERIVPLKATDPLPPTYHR